MADKLRSAWWRLAKPPLEGVAIVATDLNENLLLIRLSYGSGGWSLPTGGVNGEESAADADRRELLEETGCTAHSLKPLGIQEDQLCGTANKVSVFSAKVSEQPTADMREVVEARFFPMHSLSEPLTKATPRRLELYRESLKQG